MSDLFTGSLTFFWGICSQHLKCNDSHEMKEMMMEGICRIDEHFHCTCDFATDDKPPNEAWGLGTSIF